MTFWEFATTQEGAELIKTLTSTLALSIVIITTVLMAFKD